MSQPVITPEIADRLDRSLGNSGASAIESGFGLKGTGDLKAYPG